MSRHIPALKVRERKPMRALPLAVLMLVPAAMAHADPVQEARSATAACLSAVINGAPVEDVDGDDAFIRRGKDPVSCTVTVTAGEPVLIRETMLTAIKRRPEIFSAARTAWAPETFASREALCNLPGRRAVTAFVSTAKPGLQPVAVVTVFETPQRDNRCDRDLGLQVIAASAPIAAPAAAASPTPAPEIATAETAPPPAKPQKKKHWRVVMPHIPGISKRDD